MENVCFSGDATECFKNEKLYVHKILIYVGTMLWARQIDIFFIDCLWIKLEMEVTTEVFLSK